MPLRNKSGTIYFKDNPEFTPNLTPKEIIQLGSFGGTYFRPIKSSITKLYYNNAWKEFPKNWFNNIDITLQVSSNIYNKHINQYNIKCGSTLEQWENNGWIVKQDPYGWFQWYCRFYQGRRSKDDIRQINRWNNFAGINGRWKNNLIKKIYNGTRNFNDFTISPTIRQSLQHWAYILTEVDYKDHLFIGSKKLMNTVKKSRFGRSSMKDRIDKLINKKKVFIVSKTYCSFCVTAKRILDEYDISPEDYEIMNIENMRDCSDIQDYMMELTGGRTVPRVFIGGHFVGGGNEIVELHRKKQLRKMLQKIGAIL